MSTNPRKEEQACWSSLYNTVTKIERNNLPIEYDELVLQCIRRYPVGINQVDNHIKRFYLERNILELRDGTLYSAKYSEKKKEQTEKEIDKEIKDSGLEVSE